MAVELKKYGLRYEDLLDPWENLVSILPPPASPTAHDLNLQAMPLSAVHLHGFNNHRRSSARSLQRHHAAAPACDQQLLGRACADWGGFGEAPQSVHLGGRSC